MKNYRLSAILNTLLTGIIAFLICFVLLGFTKCNFIIKGCVSTIFCISISALILKIQLDKNNLSMLKDSEAKEALALLNYLEIMPDNRLIALFLQFFNNANIAVFAQEKNFISASLKYCFDFSKTTKREFVCEAIKNSDEKNIIIFCNKLAPECDDLLQEFKNKIAILEGYEVYSLMKRYNALPANLLVKSSKKSFFKCLLLLLKKNFTKKRALPFSIIGALLLILSKLTFFPKYYIFSALSCLTFALCCLLFGNREQKRANEILPLEFT